MNGIANTYGGPPNPSNGLSGYGAFLRPDSPPSSQVSAGEPADGPPVHGAPGNSGDGPGADRAFLRPDSPPASHYGQGEADDWPPMRATASEPRAVASGPINSLPPNPTRYAEPPRAAGHTTLADPDNSAVAPQLPTVPVEFGDLPTAGGARLRGTKGMRGALNKVGFRFGVSQSEQGELDRRERIRRPLPAMYQVAVVSVKGGVGRTTTAVTLASTFAKLRPDRVLAVDANPHFGDLATRSARHPYGLSLRDLVQAPDTSVFSSVLAYTVTNAADLAVVASPWRSELDEPLSGSEFGAASEILRRHFNLVLVDCGTGLLDSATGQVLATSHALVVVTSATFGGLNGAVATFSWLHAHGLQHLIARSVVAVVNQHPVKPNIDVSAVGELFQRAQRPTYLLPYDAHLAEGGSVDLRLLDGRSQLAFEELAAGLVDYAPMITQGSR